MGAITIIKTQVIHNYFYIFIVVVLYKNIYI